MTSKDEVDVVIDALNVAIQAVFDQCRARADLASRGSRLSNDSHVRACQEVSATFAHCVNNVMDLETKLLANVPKEVQLKTKVQCLESELKEKVRQRTIVEGVCNQSILSESLTQ
jgi:hypothetical protein